MRKAIIRLSLALGVLALSLQLPARELFIYGEALADNVAVSGVVKDADGLPVPGASVFIPGTTKGVITDDKGFFSFEVPSSTKEIKISCIGYDDVLLDISQAGVKGLSVTLKESATFLESAVAVGYGSPTPASATFAPAMLAAAVTFCSCRPKLLQG